MGAKWVVGCNNLPHPLPNTKKKIKEEEERKKEEENEKVACRFWSF